jgi:hypothetical protein
VRAADNYSVYISELLAEVFAQRPETLRTGEQVRIDEVLAHDSMESLIDAFVERRVHNLISNGITKVAEYFAKHLAFDLFESPEESDQIVEIVAARNVIVHNRGFVDKRFITRLRPEAKWQVGEQLPLSTSYVWDAIDNLEKSVQGIDRRAIDKFRLETFDGTHRRR